MTTRHRLHRRSTSTVTSWWLIVALAVMLVPHPASAQCAMCRRALQSPEGQHMIAAFRSGILFLLVAPFAVFGTVATLAIRGRRRGPDEPGLDRSTS